MVMGPRAFLIIVLSILSFGCNSNDLKGIKDSRAEFMKELKIALNEHDIPYEINDEGYIMYSGEYEDDVERIKNQVDKDAASEVGLKFEDEDSTEYFRGLLSELGIPFRTETRKDGEWTYWKPESKKQQNEIEMKVVSHSFQQPSRVGTPSVPTGNE